TIIRGDDEGEERPRIKRPAEKPASEASGTARPLSSQDVEFDSALRPQRLADVVGQRKAVERLRIMLDATRKRKEPLGHLLLDGPPGLGKTTLATVIPRELGVELQMTSAP